MIHLSEVYSILCIFVQRRGWLLRTGGAVRRGAVRLRRKLRDNERLLIVAGSSLLMSASHTALRPVLPLFAKVSFTPPPPAPHRPPGLRKARFPHLTALLYTSLQILPVMTSLCAALLLAVCAVNMTVTPIAECS